MVTLTGTLTYSESPGEQALYECRAMVFPKTLKEKEQKVGEIERIIAETDKKTQTEERLVLPYELAGTPLFFFPSMDNRGVVLIAMAVLTGILLIALEKQNQERSWPGDGRRCSAIIRRLSVSLRFSLAPA